MSRKQFGLEISQQRLDQQNVLLFGDEGRFVRADVIRQLQTLFTSCYLYGINPLPAIRKIFPALEWKHWKTKITTASPEEIGDEIARTANFVWHLPNMEVVTASRRDGRDNDKLFFVGRLHGNVHYCFKTEFQVRLLEML